MGNKIATAENCFVPYPVIAAAANGDPDAINAILKHYDGYIAKLCTRTTVNADGSSQEYVDEDMRNRLKIRLITRTLRFHLN